MDDRESIISAFLDKLAEGDAVAVGFVVGFLIVGVVAGLLVLRMTRGLRWEIEA
jgi:hypothetical protein